MKKFLSALVALSMVVAPTGNICKAESLTASTEMQINKEKNNELSKKTSAAVKSFKEVMKEHSKKIGLCAIGTASAGLLTWNGYNLVKNPDKLKEILADSKLSITDKISAIAKIMFFGVKDLVKKAQKDVEKAEKSFDKAKSNEKLIKDKIEKDRKSRSDLEETKKDAENKKIEKASNLTKAAEAKLAEAKKNLEKAEQESKKNIA